METLPDFKSDKGPFVGYKLRILYKDSETIIPAGSIHIGEYNTVVQNVLVYAGEKFLIPVTDENKKV